MTDQHPLDRLAEILPSGPSLAVSMSAQQAEAEAARYFRQFRRAAGAVWWSDMTPAERWAADPHRFRAEILTAAIDPDLYLDFLDLMGVPE